MTRLLIATGIFHPESGGPATYLYHLIPHLQEHGYEVRLLTYGSPTPQDERYGYPVTRISRDIPYTGRTWNYAQAARPLLQWAEQVYVHSLMLPLWTLPWEPRKPRVIKIVGDQAWERAVRLGWVRRTTDIDHFQVQRIRNPFVLTNKKLRQFEVRSSRGIIVPSKYLQKMAVRWGMPSSRIEVVYNALPPDHKTTTLSQVEARAQLGLDANRPTLLTVARLVPWKGVDAFIRAMDAVPDLHYIIAGDGTARADFEQVAVEAGVSDRVMFLGRIPPEQVSLYMRAADYVGLYSGYEGLSHVLVESLNTGTPVIASKKGGNPEIVRDGDNGLLVPYDDLDALRNALRTAFAPGQQEALAANTGVGLETFDYDRMVLNTVGALRRLMG